MRRPPGRWTGRGNSRGSSSTISHTTGSTWGCGGGWEFPGRRVLALDPGTGTRQQGLRKIVATSRAAGLTSGSGASWHVSNRTSGDLGSGSSLQRHGMGSACRILRDQIHQRHFTSMPNPGLAGVRPEDRGRARRTLGAARNDDRLARPSQGLRTSTSARARLGGGDEVSSSGSTTSEGPSTPTSDLVVANRAQDSPSSRSARPPGCRPSLRSDRELSAVSASDVTFFASMRGISTARALNATVVDFCPRADRPSSSGPPTSSRPSSGSRPSTRLASSTAGRTPAQRRA